MAASASAVVTALMPGDVKANNANSRLHLLK
jgi:hypothetical protein